MNKLPSDWQIKTLNEVCFPSSSNIAYKDVKDKKGNYPIFGASGIVAYADFYSKEKECLGIVKDGSVGKIFLLPAKSSVISTLNYLENTDLSDIKYLYYFLHRINFSKYIKGSVIPHIYFRDYKKEKIPLPPLATQKQIAKKLDYLFDKIDKALTFLNENKEYIKKYRLSILKYAFEGKLTLSSKNWQIKTLNEVCNIYTGNSINKKKKEENFIGLKEGLNYIGTKDISFNNIIEYENGVKIPFKDLKDFEIAKSNTSLLCIEGGSAGRKIGFTNQDVCFGNKLCCFEAIEDEPKFIYFYLQSNHFLREFNLNISGLIGGISKEKIKRIKIPIPPIETQKEIVSILDKSFKSMDEIERLNNENINNLLLLKKSLLKEAFSGRLI